MDEGVDVWMAQLYHARLGRTRSSQDGGEIQIVGEDDVTVAASPCKNLGIRSAGPSDPTPMTGCEAVRVEKCGPFGRNVHVYEDFHLLNARCLVLRLDKPLADDRLTFVERIIRRVPGV